MPAYLDISIVRIQQYLTRTVDLRGFRGASAQVTRYTSAEHVDALVAALPARRNLEAGEIDGVVSLVVEEAGASLRVASEVVASLRRQLPAAYLTGVLGDGENYVVAYEAMKQMRREGRLLIDSPPVAQFAVTASLCDRCRRWPSVAPIVDVSENPLDRGARGCSDCLMRYTSRHHGRTDAERRVRKKLSTMGWEAEFPRDFRTLAADGHLALIYADGNMVGDFIAQSIAAGISAPGLAETIHQNTLTALATAIRGAAGDHVDGNYPAIPHIIGGDDVQVSVPAHLAWAIAFRFARDFELLMTNWLETTGHSDRAAAPSMSVGLVFFHPTTPFVDVMDIAASQLKLAKRAVRGRKGSIAFVDLVDDGPDPPHSRQVIRVAQLNTFTKELTEVAAMTNSERALLREILRSDPAGREIVRERTEMAGSAVLTAVSAAPQGISVRDQLDIARWWSE